MRLEERKKLIEYLKRYGDEDSSLPWLFRWTKEYRISPDEAFKNGHYNFGVIRPIEDRYKSAWRDFKYQRPHHSMAGSTKFRERWKAVEDYDDWRLELQDFADDERDVHWKTTSCFVHPSIDLMTIDELPSRVGIALDVRYNRTQK